LPRPRSLARGEVRNIRRDAERIESGWWDGAVVGRDYHVAVDRRGARLWVYRDLQSPERWYVHGLFG
jgi:protein ImuB